MSQQRVLQVRSSRPPKDLIDAEAIKASGRVLLYSHHNRPLFRMLYGASAMHLLFWSVLSGLAFMHMTDNGASFFSTRIVDLVPSTTTKRAVPSATIVSSDASANDPSAVAQANPRPQKRAVGAIVVTSAIAAVGLAFMAATHRYASRYVSQLELVHGKTLRIKSSALVGNPFKEVPFLGTSLSQPVFTGVGPRGTDPTSDLNAVPWYQRFSTARKTSTVWLDAHGSRYRLDRIGGIFSNPEFLDRLWKVGEMQK